MHQHEPRLELGLGLIGIGRPWPTDDSEVPSEEAVDELLQHAVGRGIRFFDTAAAYGDSERRLGRFLRRMQPADRDAVTVSTKVGETWSKSSGSAVDHSTASLERSLDQSFELLGRIDLLQVHKCTAEVLGRRSVVRWLETVKHDRVSLLGASVSTISDLEAVLSVELFDYVQFPANARRREFADVFVRTAPTRVTPILNRPFGSGDLAHTPDPFRFLRETFSSGVVLSGTTSRDHLDANLASFSEAA